MSAQALYRKWRSQAFEEIVAQEHVTRTLRNALRDGRVAHAYLFTGPRGTGKTSMARLLAKAVNCVGESENKPCNECPICKSITEGRALDLIEIDAASNRGIDEVRDLRDKVGFRPGECKYRVYILDEAHMLTTPAFNALLKTLEEPPPHAIFVLVTTQPQDIPMTIISRCQRFDFHRIPVPEIVKHLKNVAAQEGFQITGAALEAIARQATGSMRDALSLLDQLMAYRQEEVTLERVQEVLGTAPLQAVSDLAHCLATADVTAGLRVINEALDRGVEPRQLNKDLLEYLRGVLVLKIGGESGLLNTTAEALAQMQQLARQMPIGKLLATIRAFNQAGLDLKDGMHPRLPLEMALVEATLPERAQPAAAPTMVVESGAAEAKEAAAHKPEPIKSDAPHPRKAAVAPPGVPATAQEPPASTSQEREETEKPAAEQEAAPAVKEPTAAATAAPGKAAPTLAWFQENWRGVLAAVRARNRSVEALLIKSCEPVEVRDNVLVLAFYHDFHKQKVEQPKNKEVIDAALSEMTGQPFVVKCVRFEGDGSQRAREKEKEEKQERQNLAIESDPIVREAVDRYGAKITDVRPLEA